MNNIKVRFAPSPTGFLHIGGARTALFNYLFAKHQNGKFVLRIEDTDQARSKPEMVDQILNALRWLNLNWDGEIVYQSAQIESHRALCRDLMDKDRAYPCFCDSEDLARKRKESEKKYGGYQYDGSCRSLTPEERQQRFESKIPFTLRFKVPDGRVAFEDMIHGHTEISTDELDDFIIQRSDGSPVYQIAVVADDQHMGITHVIRGDDHISNTYKQVLIYRAMEWDMPCFAHVPLILGPDKKRLSKRHGAASVEEYQKAGFLSEAVVNYLVLLGWSPGDDKEIMTLREMIDSFRLDRISKKSAVFDEQKLQWMNGYYISQCDDNKLLNLLKSMLIQNGLADDNFFSDNQDYIIRMIQLLKPKIRTMNEFIERGAYFFKDPVDFDEKSVTKHWKREGVPALLETLVPKLESLEEWREDLIETAVRTHADENRIPAGQLIHPIRLAITGFGVSPGLFELMALLGKERVLRRMQKALDVLPG